MIGTKLGPYEITARIGEGGMGEVYRATDTKLKRDVAIKVLPAAFTEDKERLARFEREAQLLAQLQHPNIASIYGLEESEGTRALVMELVEGPTLAERLESGPLPLNESLLLARQIAEALEEAHEKGIIHRDLKPQNIKASIEGKVKVLDFGLAKAMDPVGESGAPSASQLAASPTLTLGATVQGVILGTAAYMSPEQARGLAVDRRADIWAFGVVLYEMLTGEALFAADTVPDTLARVLTREPELDRLPSAVPPAIRRLVRRCLARRPKDRLHSIADARLVLDEVLTGRLDEPPPVDAGPSVAEVPPPSAWRRALPWIAGAVAGAAITALVAGSRSAPQTPLAASEPIIFRTLVAAGLSNSPSVSADGRTLAFESTRDGVPRVWIKDLASGSESVLVDRPSYVPAISPDGTSVLFSAEPEGDTGSLFRLALVTREERLVARDAVNGAWSPDGREVFFLRGYSFDTNGAAELRALELDGGSERLLHADPERRLNEIQVAPDGRTVAVAINSLQAGSPDGIGLLDIASGRFEERPLILAGIDGASLRGLAWISSGQLAMLLSDGDGLVERSGRIALYDVGAGELRSLLPIASVGWGIDVAGPGSLIFGIGSVDQNLHESKRLAGGGWEAPELVTEGPFRDRQPAYSPDGRWLLFTSTRSGNLDIWRRDRSTGELDRLTDHPADDWDPATSPDGKQLLFSSNRSGTYQIWIANADGSGARRLTDFENAQNPTMTADGRWIVFVRQGAAEGTNGIWKMRADGSDPTLVAAGTLLIPETSPDGRFVAFRGAGGRRLARLDDGALIDTPLADTDRYRWSVEGGRTFLWTVGLRDEGSEIRRYPFDPASGRFGSYQTILSADAVGIAESLGVARDGSAVTFASLANRRGQLLRVDGLAEIAPERGASKP